MERLQEAQVAEGLLLLLEHDPEIGLHFVYVEGDRGRKLLAPAMPERYAATQFFEKMQLHFLSPQ